jgi:hypothetical protein
MLMESRLLDSQTLKFAVKSHEIITLAGKINLKK